MFLHVCIRKTVQFRYSLDLPLDFRSIRADTRGMVTQTTQGTPMPQPERIGPGHFFMDGYGYPDVEVYQDRKQPAGRQWTVTDGTTIRRYATRKEAMNRFNADVRFILAGLRI